MNRRGFLKAFAGGVALVALPVALPAAAKVVTAVGPPRLNEDALLDMMFRHRESGPLSWSLRFCMSDGQTFDFALPAPILRDQTVTWPILDDIRLDYDGPTTVFQRMEIHRSDIPEALVTSVVHRPLCRADTVNIASAAVTLTIT